MGGDREEARLVSGCVSGLIFQENDCDSVCMCVLVLVLALLWYNEGDCNVAISGVCVRRGKPAALSSLPYPPPPHHSFFLWLPFFPRPSIFSSGELWDVDKSPDTRNNREPERKRELLSCLVTAYITVRSV